MKLSPKYLVLYQKIAWLFVKYAKPAILEQTTFASDVGETGDEGGSAPEDFVNSLESMGPTFVKLGQLLSTRGDLMPLRYIEALERLQDDVEPVPFDEIRAVVESELEVRLSKAFQEFSETPLASASLGQVHEAILRDGTEVVVKVQRPNVRAGIEDDLEALESIAQYASEHTELGKRYNFSGIIEQFRRSLLDELNYDLEAQNLRRMKGVLKKFPRLLVPETHEGFCSRRVITMSRITGVKVTELSGVAKTELNGRELADEIFRAYMHQVLIEGFYHSDPHPGNVLVTPDGKVGLIDLGMVGRLSSRMRDSLFGLLSGIGEADPDQISEMAIRISENIDGVENKSGFVGELTELVGRSRNAQVSQLQFGSVVMEVMRICSDHGLQIPREMSLLGKTMLNLDRVGMALSPEFNPNECIRSNLEDISTKRAWQSLSKGNALSALLESKELVGALPHRMNELTTILAENRLKVDVDAVDEVALIRGFQKIANRVACGAILGSMIVGASLMMDIESDFQFWGYPGFPMTLFLASGLGGAAFLWFVLKDDK